MIVSASASRRLRGRYLGLGLLLALAAPMAVLPAARADVIGGHQVSGAILARYQFLRGSSGLLGWPRTDQLPASDGVGRWQRFQRGSIFWSPRTGAHEVHGAIYRAWTERARESGPLGYPTSDEHDVPGGRRSDFSGGAVTWTPTGGTTVTTTTGTTTGGAGTTAGTAAAPWFGVLQPRTGTLGALRPTGVGRATLELGWDAFEPAPGQFDTAYLAQIRARYVALRAAGLDVVLDAGLQYPPAWIFGADGSGRFANQYGDRWRGGIGADVPDAVFDARVRREQGSYVARLGAGLRDLPFAAVRVGGLYYGETHYPTAGYAGHANSFWAYSPAAQAASPVPGYRPGQGDAATATRFLDWYLGSLADYSRWLATTYRGAFGGGPRLEVLEPSWGVRPGEAQSAADGRLTGGSRGEQRGTLNEGLDWARQLPALARVGGVEAYSTWLDAPDQGTDAGYESPVRYLVRLARPLGMAVGGENTGAGSYADMDRCVRRVRELGLAGMMWMREPELTDGAHANLQDYRALIGR